MLYLCMYWRCGEYGVMIPFDRTSRSTLPWCSLLPHEDLSGMCDPTGSLALDVVRARKPPPPQRQGESTVWEDKGLLLRGPLAPHQHPFETPVYPEAFTPSPRVAVHLRVRYVTLWQMKSKLFCPYRPEVVSRPFFS